VNIGSVEILFCLYSFIFASSLENDPLSPPVEEAPQGEHPLEPLFLGYISALSGVIATGGIPERRGGSMKIWSPQERLFVSMRISTEPEYF
jgi:hypothetical protein